MAEFCVDDRHGTPCPEPCKACEECDGPRIEADDPIEAARKAGWGEAYIAQMDVSYWKPS